MQNSTTGSAFRFVVRKEPGADGALRAVEEVAGEGDHAVQEVDLDESAVDLAFAGLIGGYAAIGKDEAGGAPESLTPVEGGVRAKRTSKARQGAGSASGCQIRFRGIVFHVASLPKRFGWGKVPP